MYEWLNVFLIQFFESVNVLLLPTIEKWLVCVDDSQIGGTILTDLSKTFNCINKYLIIAKFHAYGFSYKPLNFIRSYLTDWKERTRINHTYSSYSYVTCVVA